MLIRPPRGAAALGVAASTVVGEHIRRPGLSITEQDARGLPEPPFDGWGDGPAAYAPGEAPMRAGDRTPPQDMAAEQSVLGSMLLSKDAIADVTEVLRGVDFYRPSHEIIHDAIIDLFGRGEPADRRIDHATCRSGGCPSQCRDSPQRRNQLLDRALHVGTPSDPGLGYFTELV